MQWNVAPIRFSYPKNLHEYRSHLFPRHHCLHTCLDLTHFVRRHQRGREQQSKLCLAVDRQHRTRLIRNIASPLENTIVIDTLPVLQGKSYETLSGTSRNSF